MQSGVFTILLQLSFYSCDEQQLLINGFQQQHNHLVLEALTKSLVLRRSATEQFVGDKLEAAGLMMAVCLAGLEFLLL